MILKKNAVGECFDGVSLKRMTAEECSESLGAAPAGENIIFKLRVPRRIGALGAVLRLALDGEQDADYSFTLSSQNYSEEEYTLTLKLTRGLYFYEILLLRGLDTLFSSTDDNKSMTFCRESGRRFSFLVYGKSGQTFLPGGVMYHVFVDRFARSESRDTPRRNDAVYEEDWHSGNMQFAQNPGGFVKNNFFFGGSLFGVCEKLDYLSSLGVTVLYLSPIFKAYSNHKYDTGDYETVDPCFGGEEALCELIEKAHERGMKVILDGVFNHTGDDSKYFNRRGTYENLGAYQSKDSEYFDWYRFGANHDDYESWWGIKILPRLNHEKPECRAYFCSEGGICEKYMRMGADGFRLDVADELNDAFLCEFRERLSTENRNAALIGEVWENAALKEAYGKRRHYFEGDQLHSVMNYPFRTALLDAFREGDVSALAHTLTTLYSTYPREVSHSLMNLLGSHDTERILSVLGGAQSEGLSGREANESRLTEDAREIGKRRLMAASTLQYTVYGFPSVYYGDEAGLEGLFDPFCRRPYPWGREDKDLLAHYRALGEMRKDPVFARGEFDVILAEGPLLVFERRSDGKKVTVAVNVSEVEVTLPFTLKGRSMLDESKVSLDSLTGYGFAVISSEKERKTR